MKKLVVITLSILSILLIIFFGMHLYDGSKETLMIEAKSYEHVYDGEVHTVSGFLNESEKGIKVSDKNGVTYYVTGIVSEYEGKDVEDSVKEISTTGQAVVKNKDGDDVSKRFKVEVKKGSFKITPTKLTLKSKTLSKTYDGKPLKNNNQKLDIELGWKKGDGATYKFTASQKEIGSCSNTFEVVAKEGTDLKNYTITKTEGKLIVKKVEKKINISVQANGLTCTYDGQEHSVSGFENMDANGQIVFTHDGAVYYISGLTSEAKGKDVQDSIKNIKIKGKPKITSSSGEDCTQMFTLSLHQGSLIIKKANVTLESASISKDYDGTNLTNGDHAITEHGWIDGEGASYTFTGSQLDPGSSTNSFDYSLKSNTKEDNYKITKKEGTLTVKPINYSITVTGLSYEGEYDGKVHEISGFENMDASGQIVCETKGKTFYVSGLVSYCSSKDATDIEIPVSGNAIVMDENGVDYTKYVDVHIINGTFKIDPISITLESKSASKSYDGKPLKCEELVDEDDLGFIEEEGIDIKFTSSITEKGECDNEFEYEFNEDTNKDNYDIKIKFGTLTIK